MGMNPQRPAATLIIIGRVPGPVLPSPGGPGPVPAFCEVADRNRPFSGPAAIRTQE